MVNILNFLNNTKVDTLTYLFLFKIETESSFTGFKMVATTSAAVGLRRLPFIFLFFPHGMIFFGILNFVLQTVIFAFFHFGDPFQRLVVAEDLELGPPEVLLALPDRPGDSHHLQFDDCIAALCRGDVCAPTLD